MASKETAEVLSIHELQDRNGSEDQYEKTVTNKGGTARDSEDMRRMGRVQELRVRRYSISSDSTVLTDVRAAQLQIREHRWFCHNLTSNLGMHTSCQLARTSQWRHRRHHLVHDRSMVLHVGPHGIDSGDGVHGS